MGNWQSDSIQLLDNTDIDEPILFETIGEVVSSKYLDIGKGEVYQIYLCENDLVLKGLKRYRIIYQKINSWVTYNSNMFGFYIYDNKSKQSRELVFDVLNPVELSDNLRNITHNLVDYYKNIKSEDVPS